MALQLVEPSRSKAATHSVYGFASPGCRSVIQSMSSAGLLLRCRAASKSSRYRRQPGDLAAGVVVRGLRVAVAGDDRAGVERLDDLQRVQPAGSRLRRRAPPTQVRVVVDDVAGDDQAQVGHVHDGRQVGVGGADGENVCGARADRDVRAGERGRRDRRVGQLPGKNELHTSIAAGEICPCMAAMDSAAATGRAFGKARRIACRPRR